ncbi:hypothetical protein Tco_0073500 [Tanacetum coccineum]
MGDVIRLWLCDQIGVVLKVCSAWRGGDGVVVALAVMGWCGDQWHGSGDGVGWKVAGILSRLCARILGIALASDIAFICDSLLLTPLCCDDIHDVTARVSALAGCDRLVAMSPPIRRKYRDSVAFATGCRKIKNCKWKRCNRKIRIPIGMWPCRVEEKMTLKEVDGKTVEEIERRKLQRMALSPGFLENFKVMKRLKKSQWNNLEDMIG